MFYFRMKSAYPGSNQNGPPPGNFPPNPATENVAMGMHCAFDIYGAVNFVFDLTCSCFLKFDDH
jgi:hypothetical protein